ncbi:MAG: CrcB family protein [Actinomycetota bacterium]
MTRRLALAFLGGCIGGALRLAMGLAWDTGTSVPWELLAINLLGSLAIGAVAVLWGGHPGVWPLLGPGVLGGFTTFSGLAAMNWTTASGPVVSFATLGVWMVVCTVAARVGMVAAERWRQRRPA